jgi:hypothetical protein
MKSAAAALLLMCAATLASGCNANSYAGIPLAAGAADPELQDLARRARSGEERAQLELGIRFEEGRGVPVDLRRARRLYFDAATRRTRSAEIYIPTPGSATSSIVRTLPGDLQFSGLEEALVRWHRLMPRGRRDQPRTLTSAATPAGPRSERHRPIEIDEAHLQHRRRHAVVTFGYAPLLGNLRSFDRPWSYRLSGQAGLQLIDEATLEDSFALLLGGAPGQPGARASQPEVRQFCTERLATDQWSVAEVRLLALCAMAGEPTGTVGRGFAAARAAIVRYAPGGRADDPDPASDLILLFRASQRCGCYSPAAELIEEAAREMLRWAPAVPQCSIGDACWSAAAGRPWQGLHAPANLLFAHMEEPGHAAWSGGDVAAALAMSARFVASRLDHFADRDADDIMPRICRELAVEYRECRRAYYNAPLVPPKVAFILAEFVGGVPAARCARLRERLANFGEELSFRPGIAEQLARFERASCRSS